MHTRTYVCSCNGTVKADSQRLQSALGSGVTVVPARELCRGEAMRFVDGLSGTDDVVVSCTQEAPLFRELADAKATVSPVRFVNIRESAGWGREGDRAEAKIAALLAMSAVGEAPAVESIGFASQGRVLVIGDAEEALYWAERFAGRLSPTVLITSGRAAMPAERHFPVLSGELVSLTGWLGAFEARWRVANPIDLEACVRCGACVQACPEGAIGANLQVDLDACRGHRACVAACADIGAIDFARADALRSDAFDLVFDLRRTGAFAHQAPLGYLHPGDDIAERMRLALEATDLVGEFDKPKFFRYEQRICAHERNSITGCSRCIDTCSTKAIAPQGDGIRVEPHLCLGCGACGTVCPTGAIAFQYPRPSHLGDKLRRGLSAYRKAGGQAAAGGAVVLLVDAAGQRLVESLGRDARTGFGPVAKAPAVAGLPARVIPVEVHHPASVGLDVWLGALAFGAAQVAVLLTGHEDEGYRAALRDQLAIGQAIVGGTGLSGRHLHLVEAGDAAALSAALGSLGEAESVAQAATFALPDEKRRAIDFAVEHLVAQTRLRDGTTALPATVALPARSPFGAIAVDKAKCTMCMACAGACPASALADGGDQPLLRFLERNCVQCGLCAATCPEDAITLEPRYDFSPAARAHRTVNESEPFGCVRCGKPFGTKAIVERMVGRLTTHAMFAGSEASRRLQMCADCRVVDMFENKGEVTINDVTRG